MQFHGFYLHLTKKPTDKQNLFGEENKFRRKICEKIQNISYSDLEKPAAILYSVRSQMLQRYGNVFIGCMFTVENIFNILSFSHFLTIKTRQTKTVRFSPIFKNKLSTTLHFTIPQNKIWRTQYHKLTFSCIQPKSANPGCPGKESFVWTCFISTLKMKQKQSPLCLFRALVQQAQKAGLKDPLACTIHADDSTALFRQNVARYAIIVINFEPFLSLFFWDKTKLHAGFFV